MNTNEREDWEALRRLRPDLVEPDDPPEPTRFTRHKEELMSAINPTTPQPITQAVIDRLPDIYPRLAYEDERAALDYLTRVFQFQEIREARADYGDTMMAWLVIGNGAVMIGHANEEIHQISSPQTVGRTTVQMMVYVDDVDAHYVHACEQGAQITMAIQDAFYGERRYEATDLEGHRWHFAERFEHIRARGGSVEGPPAP